MGEDGVSKSYFIGRQNKTVSREVLTDLNLSNVGERQGECLLTAKNIKD